MSVSPFFQSLLGSDLDAEELLDDALLPRVIEIKYKQIRTDDELTEQTLQFERALTQLKIVGTRFTFYKAKRAAEDVVKRAKMKDDADLQIAVARTDAKLRRRPLV